MRFVNLATSASVAAVLVLSSPAMAQDADSGAADHALARAADAMSDPARQQQVAAMAQAVMGAMMEMPVAPLMRAAASMSGEEAEDIDPDLRLADVAGPDARASAGQIADRVPAMMQTLAAFTYAFDGVLPQLREAMEKAAQSAASGAPSRD